MYFYMWRSASVDVVLMEKSLLTCHIGQSCKNAVSPGLCTQFKHFLQTRFCGNKCAEAVKKLNESSSVICTVSSSFSCNHKICMLVYNFDD